jgi:multisubunit Na+/H+ antiporter MnhC subunit
MMRAFACRVAVGVLLTGWVVNPALARHPGLPLTEMMNPVVTAILLGALAIGAGVLVAVILVLLRRR